MEASRGLRQPRQDLVPARTGPAQRETRRVQTLNANLWGPHTLSPQTDSAPPGHTLNP